MPRDGAIIFDGLIGQARRAPDCGKRGRSIFHQVLAAQMPPTFSMGVDKWKCANVPSDCRIYFRGRMKASRITTAKPWRRQSNCYSNKPTLRRINRQARRYPPHPPRTQPIGDDPERERPASGLGG
jgi:hypothetical protein